MKRFLLITISLLLFFLMGCSQAESVETYNELIRLHIIANSDSKEDQQIKLKVRDAVQATLEPQLDGINDSGEALKIVKANSGKIEEAALKALADEGVDQNVTTEIGIFPFPERDYDGVVVPAGDYNAVRVKIGDSLGKNWWCIVFPPLCVVDGKVSKEALEQFIEDGKMPEPEVRSAIGDWFEKLFSSD